MVAPTLAPPAGNVGKVGYGLGRNFRTLLLHPRGLPPKCRAGGPRPADTQGTPRSTACRVIGKHLRAIEGRILKEGPCAPVASALGHGQTANHVRGDGSFPRKQPL